MTSVQQCIYEYIPVDFCKDADALVTVRLILGGKCVISALGDELILAELALIELSKWQTHSA